MCGIAGIYNFSDTATPVSENNLTNMLARIRHRGPDESGIFIKQNIGIGNVRLSIIDLKTGQQPLCDFSNRYWIVYNGELFNYIELKSELEKQGSHFKTTCDTEVVLEAYVKYGADCLNKFNGQFAIAIWDTKEKQLFLARDRVGIRPLFYTENADTFYFCSEIKGIFENPEITPQLSQKSLAQIFTIWTSISPNTPFEKVFEIPPGHFMTINSKGKTIKKYWSLKYNSYNNPINFKDAQEELRFLLKDAVKIRLRADVQVAAYLSGGLDSSATTAMIHDHDASVLNTFSIGFEDKVFDESGFQDEAADYFKTNHKGYTCNSKDIAKYFYDTVYHSEFPILRTAPTPMYLLSKKVRENNIKVVITGEGADEMLAGYNIFKESMIRRFWAKDPKSSIRPLLLKKLYPYLPIINQANNTTLKLFFGCKLKDISNPLYSHLLRWHNTARIKSYFSPEIRESIKTYNTEDELSLKLDPEFENWSHLAQSQYLETSIFMSGYLLSSQGDRMAMANSVEGRYPFLDHRVIEFCNQLPDDFKLHGLTEKYILKELIRGEIPDSILSRSKQAYRAPVSDCFNTECDISYIGEMLSSPKIEGFGLFDFDRVSLLLDKKKEQKAFSEMDNMALAGILSTQLVHHFFIEKNIPAVSKNDLKNLRIIRA
jgi:asparagine synthase (glutamine-hydrolysing)